MPAKAGIQVHRTLDSRLRGSDVEGTNVSAVCSIFLPVKEGALYIPEF
jgi:hypothetical protein